MTMHTLVLHSILLVLFLGLHTPSTFAGGLDTPESTAAEFEWGTFSENLAAALASDNDGLRASALQMLIHYGDHLDVRRATFDVVRIYRDHPDERLRRLAVVALSEMGSPWALDFLSRSLPYERSPRVRHTIRAVLAVMPTA